MASTLLSVSAVLLLGAVLIFSLLTILILSKKLKLESPKCFFLLGSGFSLALSSALCREARLWLL
jgi:hypothetical protein